MYLIDTNQFSSMTHGAALKTKPNKRRMCACEGHVHVSSQTEIFDKNTESVSQTFLFAKTLKKAIKKTEMCNRINKNVCTNINV